MILKSLTLENIRSYKELESIKIPTGTILFEGDIASGKSSLLYAIEFALFGTGSLRGSFLLRNGAREGWVSLHFLADGKDYEVHRTLVRKGKGVQQGDCYLKDSTRKSVLSPSELKEKVLQVLGFNEPPNPRAQSVIYRYAIFTPQEEMKEVILKDADERLQTLRRAFRIEDYKTAVENSSTLEGRIKLRVAHLEGVTGDLDEVRGNLKRVQERSQKLRKELEPQKETERAVCVALDEKRRKLKRMEKSREEIKKAEARIPLLENGISEKSQNRIKLIQENQRLKRKIEEELEPKIAKLETILKPTEKTSEQLREDLKKIRLATKEKQKLKTQLEERIANFSTVIEKKICPICERPIDSKEFGSKSRHLEKETKKLEAQIANMEKKCEETELRYDRLNVYQAARAELDDLRPQIEESMKMTRQNDDTIDDLGGTLERLNLQLKSVEAETKPMKEILTDIQKLESEIEELDIKRGEAGKRVAETAKEIALLEESRPQLEEWIGLKEKELRMKDSLTEHRMWLSEYFAPTVKNIELHVMTSLNQRFNQHFLTWFQLLIEDPDLRVRVDEDFSPLIEREGYDQDFATLSGGERTSVALAYRLALNTTVQEVATSGGPSILILDEPTDGFSKEQLFKIRDILSELKCPQVILVSHERELEGFADIVFRVEKEDGSSRITRLRN